MMEFLPIIDQELHLNLDYALEELSERVERHRPHAVLTLAYEGGHPDHDCCSVLGALLGERFELPVWEMRLYHRLKGKIHMQSFVARRGGEAEADAMRE